MLKSFQELEAWKKTHAITSEVYRLTKGFPKQERFGMVSQLRRCATSVGANIAEGFGLRSTKDFVRYLEIASGSLEETRYFLIMSRDLGYCQGREFRSRMNTSMKLAGCWEGWAVLCGSA